MTGASGASRQKLSTNSRRKSGTRPAGHQPTAADRRPDAIPHGMARLLRLLPDPSCAHEPRSVDPPKITLVSVAAVAERAQPLQRTAPAWRTEVQGSGRRRGSGACPDTRRSNRPCAITTSTHLVFPDFALFFELRKHLLWALIERVDDAKLRRTLDQVCLRL